ncbi:MAG TPA: hypothetical protein VFA33_18160 [Bryobacteraceae bacterium]|nr:hypothetical protein [Bryobacteraceae bacterium]
MRYCLLLLVSSLAFTCFAESAKAPEAAKPVSVRGTLTQKPGQGPTLETASHQTIFLSGDEGTMKVLNDPRVRGFDLEAKGHFTAPDKFQVDPLYTKAMFVHKDGHLKVITYWCDTCSIRTYAPGPCWCCQQETTLDLRDPDAYKNDK